MHGGSGAWLTCDVPVPACVTRACPAWLWATLSISQTPCLGSRAACRSLYESSGRNLPMDEITAGQLPQLVAGRHLPLCMTVMYERLTGEHHLKHWGLQQFSLFLKAIGMPLEQAMLFFRHQFSPRWVEGGGGTRHEQERVQRSHMRGAGDQLGRCAGKQGWRHVGCTRLLLPARSPRPLRRLFHDERPVLVQYSTVQYTQCWCGVPCLAAGPLVTSSRRSMRTTYGTTMGRRASAKTGLSGAASRSSARWVGWVNHHQQQEGVCCM